MFKNNLFPRIVGVVLFLALLVGVGYAGYQFGYRQGLADSPQMVEWMGKWIEPGAPPAFGPGIPGGFRPFGFHPLGGFHHFGFFSFFCGLIGLLFLLFMFFGIMRLIFRPHWHKHGPWHGYPPPPWAQQPQPPSEPKE